MNKLILMAAALALTGSAIAGTTEAAQCKNLTVNAEFKAPLARLGPFIIENGGARIVDCGGAKYLLAVGMTDLRADSAREKLRRLTVARAKAVKALVRMLEQAKIEVREESGNKVKIVQRTGAQPEFAHETVSLEHYREELESCIKLPEVIAAWQSADDQFFCVAIGKKLSAAK